MDIQTKTNIYKALCAMTEGTNEEGVSYEPIIIPSNMDGLTVVHSQNFFENLQLINLKEEEDFLIYDLSRKIFSYENFELKEISDLEGPNVRFVIFKENDYIFKLFLNFVEASGFSIGFDKHVSDLVVSIDNKREIKNFQKNFNFDLESFLEKL